MIPTPGLSLKVTLVCVFAVAVSLLIFKTGGLSWPWIVSTGFILLVMQAVLRRLFGPLADIRQGLRIVREGNLDYRIRNDGRDELGRLAQSVDSMTEILQQVTAERETLRSREYDLLRRSEVPALEERFLRLFENPNYGIFFCDFDGRITDVNQTACSMLLYSRDELLRIPFEKLYEERQIHQSRAATRLRREDNAIRFESVFLRKDQSTLDVEIGSNIIDLRREQILYVVHDITRRKEIESRLRESEEKFRSFMESATDMMFITNSEGRFLYANEAMIRGLGVTAGRLPEMHVRDVFCDLQNTQPLSVLEALITDGGQSREMTWITEAQRKVQGELKATGIYSDSGEFQGIRGVFRDVSERRKIEESQRLAQLGKLVASVAHEIKNQLTAILGMSELSLQGGDSPDEIMENMQVVYEQANHMNEFVRRLLAFSRPGQGQMRPVQMNEILRLVTRLVEKQFLKSRVQIRMAFDEGLPPVFADEKQMSEVLMNLMQNAFEAIAPPGEVSIRTGSRDGMVEIAVSDTGSGISDENLKHIFDPFFTTKEQGTGLGLSVCYGIVEAHGGRLEYRSEAGKGTTAVLTLPIYLP